MKLTLASSLLLLALAVAAPTPHASEPAKVQYSMLVDGKIRVSPQGTVTSYSLNNRDKLPQVVVKLIDQAVPKWRFLPPTRDGKPAAIDGKMSMRVIAKSIAGGKFDLHLGSYWVGTGDSGDVIRRRSHAAPQYPPAAIRSRASGTVYFVMQVDKSGHVTKAAVEQVNLFAKGTSKAMTQARKLLSDATIAAARNWTFDVPTSGPLSTLDHWDVRSRVSYNIEINGRGPRHDFKPGHWSAYIPGPKQTISWLQQPKSRNAGVDALPGNGAYLVDQQNGLIRQPRS